jgi:hypothetical protein
MDLQRLFRLLQLPGYSWRRRRHKRDKGVVNGIYNLSLDYICLIDFLFSHILTPPHPHTSYTPHPPRCVAHIDSTSFSPTSLNLSFDRNPQGAYLDWSEISLLHTLYSLGKTTLKSFDVIGPLRAVRRTTVVYPVSEQVSVITP